MVLLLASSTIFKEVRRPLNQGLLPGMDLARVDFKPAGQLCNGVLPLERGQSHFGLEDWPVLLNVFASCPAPSFRPILGAGLSLSHLSEFWGPPQMSYSRIAGAPTCSGVGIGSGVGVSVGSGVGVGTGVDVGRTDVGVGVLVAGVGSGVGVSAGPSSHADSNATASKHSSPTHTIRHEDLPNTLLTRKVNAN